MKVIPQTSKQILQFPLTNPKPKKSPENKQTLMFDSCLLWPGKSCPMSHHLIFKLFVFIDILFEIVLVWNNVVSSRMKRKARIAEPRGAVELKGDGTLFQQRCLGWHCAGGSAGHVQEMHFRAHPSPGALERNCSCPGFFCLQSATAKPASFLAS